MSAPPRDRDLMMRYREGDTRAFETLYTRHRAPLFRYVLRHTGNPAIAEEVYQEVWMKVINAAESYRPVAKFTTWLYRLAHNACVDQVRYASRRPAAAGGDAPEPEALPAEGLHAGNPVQAALNDEAGARLVAALATLPPEQREAFLLREEGGLGLAEIAEVTGVGRETVKSRLRYALRKLRETLTETEHE